MLGRDHVITSVCLVMAGALWVDHGVVVDQHLFSSMTFVAATGVGALAPDLDAKNSLASQKFGSGLAHVFQHRGFLHSLFGWALWSYLWYLAFHYLLGTDYRAGPTSFTWLIWAGLVLGYLLHLIEDSFSVAGIRWFNPLTPYDQWSYQHYQTLLRPVNHWKKTSDGHKIPVRHWWGRGYQTGSENELALVGAVAALFVVALLRAMFG